MAITQWFKMPYYHVYLAYKDKKGVEVPLFGFNLTEEMVRQRIANPYMKNEAFMMVRRVIHPSDVQEIEIYKSEKKAKELILPNGKSPIETENNYFIVSCFSLGKVKGVTTCTWDFIVSSPKMTIALMDYASFLGLDTNWSLSTCALQLQEVAVILVAKRKNIRLDKANVERLLNKKIEELSFNDKYEAFSRQVKDSFNVEIPILTTDLRRMRTRVLHKGYNPKPEETESIASFTIGLLRKLKGIG